jgi:fatty-acyl-CoA synthase
MLKVGGENVSPLEVEGYLLQRHPLRQIAVVGVPDERLGEVPVAFVEVAAGDASDGSALEQAFAESCRGHIASYKIPRRVFVVEALPMTASGKVQKHLLRDRARALLDSTP